MDAPTHEGRDVFKIVGRSISRWLKSFKQASHPWKSRVPSFLLVISIVGLVVGTLGWIISGVLAANSTFSHNHLDVDADSVGSLPIMAVRGETLTWTIHVNDALPGYWASDTGLVLELDGGVPLLYVLHPQPNTWDQYGTISVPTTAVYVNEGLTITTTLTIPTSISGPEERVLSGELYGTLEYPIAAVGLKEYEDETLNVSIPVQMHLVSQSMLDWMTGLTPSYLFAGEDVLSGVVLVASLVLMRLRRIASEKAPGRGWQTRTLHSRLTLNGVAWTGVAFVAVGDQGTILSSPNGQTWTQHPSGTSRRLLGVACSGAQWVAVGEAGTILTSSAGGPWTLQPTLTSHTLYMVIWLGTQFVAVGDEGTILSSPDGAIWTTHPSGTSHRLFGVAQSEAQMVVVGASGTILTSPDGRTWMAQPAGTSQALGAVAWTGAQFVAVGKNNGTLLTSSNGSIWTVQRPLPKMAFDIIWAGTQLVVVGRGGTIFTSPTGKEWTTQAYTFYDLYRTAWSGYRLVVVGEKGTILTSA